MVDIYRGQTKQNAKVEQIKIKLPVRLIIYGGAKSASDNSAFLHASKNVIKDYRNDLPIKSYFMSQGIKQLINAINKEAENSVQSLDIFSHGSEEGLYTVLGASVIESITESDVKNKNLASNIYRNYMTKYYRWTLFGESNLNNLYVISNINFKKFTIESKIEIHGCHSAFDGERDTLCALMSKALYQAGKKRSVVIGHADFATPNRGGTKVISQQDYRHEERVIYNNGNVIARTRAEGRISSSFIKKALGG
ncbi:hypothetical protein [Acinetobacter bereziniae]|uniref:hypothetical protein n=2 Tax=Acinetobacter TaxID=469 RepID=UPI000C2C4F64|nr:hypothetical protein [Acinetobacter bereziniae]ATZ64623.1 hypothetical protein BSR55_15350 [Acinetobacter bereziniae]